jgi:hypothetical protein
LKLNGKEKDMGQFILVDKEARPLVVRKKLKPGVFEKITEFFQEGGWDEFPIISLEMTDEGVNVLIFSNVSEVGRLRAELYKI